MSSLRINQIVCGDCVQVMRGMADKCIPLTVTSPPYGEIRPGHSQYFRFEPIADQLYRVTKDGGVLVWVTKDQQADFGESLESFRQASYFQKCGFKVQTLIMEKGWGGGTPHFRYGAPPEYAFICIKGARPRVFRPVKRPSKHAGKQRTIEHREADGTFRAEESFVVNDNRVLGTVWPIATGKHTAEEEWVRRFPHGGLMPEAQAERFIQTYSGRFDLVFDPMAGLGTTCKMAVKHHRFYFGAEIDPEYHRAAVRRLQEYKDRLGRTA